MRDTTHHRSGYSVATTLAADVETTTARVRQALTDQGFGVLTEIDLSATLREKVGAEIAPHVILGACRPPLAHAAVTSEPSIGLLLPCNVVVRASGEGTVVEAIDPATMVEITGNPDLVPVADDARTRLVAALGSLGGTPLA